MRGLKLLPAIVIILLNFLLALTASGCIAQAQDKNKTVFVLFDISSSTQAQREQYLEDFKKVVANVKPGDTIVVDKISDNPLSQSVFPVHETLKERKSSFNDNILIARNEQKRFYKEFEDKKQSMIMQAKALLKKDSDSTDILGSLHLAERVFKTYPHNRGVLVIISDMYHQSSDYNFMAQDFSNNSILQIINNESIERGLPDLNGVKVYVSGAAGKSTDKMISLRKFWLRFFKAMGAVLLPEDYGSSLLVFNE